jgi:hypothetical protein
LRRLGRLVDIVDAERGAVHVKSESQLVDVLSVEMVSVLTTMGTGRAGPVVASGPDRQASAGRPVEPVCSACGFLGRFGDVGCERCGEPLGGSG